ncbi:MAG: hypothetical protein A2812_00770 [Candidatus Staskawiczbacteria bacterium RIFCSPHIGHO2_01_FULL_36_16]|uniref:Uncharacterized protein n=1 Tax=Candidatus Staskawiczbacteria bacterium RIFCSPHIGHO2_01_FULL_36_16 TaxID=1802200 RepID=A0A1G2HRM8_9BACT|nr:MAG: hypothetical protein A2812_00770 [Candidatus Staskawiczbacteria bacterium RIFCSPHIGHO2_01_FULL_36_16]
MSGIFQQGVSFGHNSSEEKFEALICGKNLSEAEREALRKFYGLPFNDILLSKIDSVPKYVVMAWQKIRGNSFCNK